MLKRLIIVVTLASLIALTMATPSWANWEFRCISEQGADCWYSLIATGTQPVITDAEYIPPSSLGVPDPCTYVQATQPPPDDPAWGGHDPEHGRLWYSLCAGDFGDASWDGSGNTIVNYVASDPYYVPDGDTPDGAAAAIDPMVLVERATGSLDFPAPAPVFGPDQATLAVKVPVWLSVTPFPPVTQTASAGALTATVTAELTSTTWEMGEPIDPAAPGALVAPVVCAGSGVPYSAGMDPGAPPCGYTYVWRSLPERTAGTGTWPVTVTSHYTTSWTVTDAAGAVVDQGTDSVDAASTSALQVREWHSILIDRPPT